MKDSANSTWLTLAYEVQEEIESDYYPQDTALLKRLVAAVRSEDRKQLEQTVLEIRALCPLPSLSILPVLLDTIDIEVLGKEGTGRFIICPNCSTKIFPVMDHIFLARRTCPSCRQDVVVSDEPRD